MVGVTRPTLIFWKIKKLGSGKFKHPHFWNWVLLKAGREKHPKLHKLGVILLKIEKIKKIKSRPTDPFIFQPVTPTKQFFLRLISAQPQ
jgi:hypothetical protein